MVHSCNLLAKEPTIPGVELTIILKGLGINDEPFSTDELVHAKIILRDDKIAGSDNIFQLKVWIYPLQISYWSRM